MPIPRGMSDTDRYNEACRRASRLHSQGRLYAAAEAHIEAAEIASRGAKADRSSWDAWTESKAMSLEMAGELFAECAALNPILETQYVNSMAAFRMSAEAYRSIGKSSRAETSDKARLASRSNAIDVIKAGGPMSTVTRHQFVMEQLHVAGVNREPDAVEFAQFRPAVEDVPGRSDNCQRVIWGVLASSQSSEAVQVGPNRSTAHKRDRTTSRTIVEKMSKWATGAEYVPTTPSQAKEQLASMPAGTLAFVSYIRPLPDGTTASHVTTFFNDGVEPFCIEGQDFSGRTVDQQGIESDPGCFDFKMAVVFDPHVSNALPIDYKALNDNVQEAHEKIAEFAGHMDDVFSKPPKEITRAAKEAVSNRVTRAIQADRNGVARPFDTIAHAVSVARDLPAASGDGVIADLRARGGRPLPDQLVPEGGAVVGVDKDGKAFVVTKLANFDIIVNPKSMEVEVVSGRSPELRLFGVVNAPSVPFTTGRALSELNRQPSFTR